jgi:hypothetical protein
MLATFLHATAWRLLSLTAASDVPPRVPRRAIGWAPAGIFVHRVHHSVRRLALRDVPS